MMRPCDGDARIAVSFLCVVYLSQDLVLGLQFVRPGDACCWLCLRGLLCEAGDMCFRLTPCLSPAAWRRHVHCKTHPRGCFWFEQRRCVDFLGSSKLACHFCIAAGRATAVAVELLDFAYAIGWFEFVREVAG